MNIAKQIKTNRLSLKWTQEQLAESLNVSRSTVSSWEVGRNYPDLETIVALSDLFDISLDELLRGDKLMLEQISDDTKIRKKQSKKINILLISLTISLLVICFFIFQKFSIQDISHKEQIESTILTTDNNLVVKTKLPFYRSTVAYFYDVNTDNPTIMDLRISEKIDFSMKHQETIHIPINQEIFPVLNEINILDSKGTIINTISTTNK